MNPRRLKIVLKRLDDKPLTYGIFSRHPSLDNQVYEVAVREKANHYPIVAHDLLVGRRDEILDIVHTPQEAEARTHKLALEFIKRTYNANAISLTDESERSSKPDIKKKL